MSSRSNARSDADYLHALADRLRGARARRGMTRAALAADSSVSLRFLAQLEAGQGNPSVLVLRRIADALGFPLDTLLPGERFPSVERSAASRLLDGLTTAELARAHALLAERFGMAGSTGTWRSYVALVGLRGAGKSTLGRRLAEDRGVPFFELDREVERMYGATIGEILQLHGQPGYRRFEREALQAILSAHPAAVIATGGGLAADPQTLPYLLAHALTVWIRATPEEHMKRVVDQGDLRPMAHSRQAMRELTDILAARAPFYRQAHRQLVTSGKTVEQSFAELRALIADDDADQRRADH